jgi:hypothetical protein
MPSSCVSRNLDPNSKTTICCVMDIRLRHRLNKPEQLDVKLIRAVTLGGILRNECGQICQHGKSTIVDAIEFDVI